MASDAAKVVLAEMLVSLACKWVCSITRVD
jgi:hypothetical protein